MTVLRTVIPRASSSDDPDTESMLQHFYLVAAFAIVLALVALRIIVLRKRNQSLSSFFRISSNAPYSYGSYPPHDSNHGAIFHGIQLAPVPAVYRPDRTLRAADLDGHGRRLSPAGEQWEGKEALPAYDNLDRPPKYLEAGWSHGVPPPSTEQPATSSSPEVRQSGTVHPETTGGSSTDQPSSGTCAAAGAVRGSEAPLPPTRGDSSGSG